MSPRKRLRRRHSRQARLAAAVTLSLSGFARASDYDTIGLTQLLSIDPTLTGTGIRVAQVEANDTMATNTFEFEANPNYVGQPQSLFTYIDQNGNATTTFNQAQESGHADFTGDIFYGTPSGHFDVNGMLPNVSHVDNYFSDYFTNTIVPNELPIPDTIANLNFSVVPSLTLPQAVAVQQLSDTNFDNYIDTFGTIMVFGVGNSGSVPYPPAPSTCYNGIAISSFDANSSVGPTIDNGRSKPDIVAPGSLTSFSMPLVSGSEAILVQAAQNGDAGSTPEEETAAVDFRTVKALILNGANKITIPFTRTPDAPLDPINGAGMVNVYNSYEQLVAGQHGPTKISTTTSVGASHAPHTNGTTQTALNGWDFGTLTSSATNDTYANYTFHASAETAAFTLTATMDWARPFNPNTATPIGINTFGMFLYDATSRLLLDWSDSAVDNVQDVFDQNLIPGHTYDLEVLKHGGAGALTNSETYAIAFSTTPDSGNPAGYPAVWTGGNASWGDNAQWYNQVIPEEGGETANFTDAISSPTTITLDANWTIGNINFFNTNAYTIAPGAGGGAIGIFNGNKTCDITDALGTHYITAPVYLLTSLQVTVVNTTDALQISGNISGTGSLIMYGAGTLTLSGSNSYQGGTTILTGGLVAGSPGALPTNSNVTVGDGVHAASLRLAPGSGPANLSSLQINVNSIVDIGNNSLTINYGQVVNDPIYDVVTDLISGYNNGTWTGTSGIISSAAAQAQGGPALSIGYADGDAETDSGASPNQILLKFTLLGDANLDGLVNFQDLVAVVQNFNKFGTDWAHGNFLYGETTSFNDLIAVVQNLNKILPTGAFDGGPIFTMPIVSATAVQVPEPSSLALIAAGAGGLLARRRRRTRTALNANAATPVGSGRTLSVSVVSVLVSSRV